MDSFEYLIALVSVIAGLGITRALSGIARLVDARRRITFSWIPLCWTASALLWLVAFWWFTFLLSSIEGWSTALHIFVLVYAGCIFFLVALLHPESIPDGHDMLEHFLDNRKLFFGTLLAVGLLDLADTWIKTRFGLTPPPLFAYTMHMAPWIVFSAVAMFVRNRTFHVVFALWLLLSFVAWLGWSIDGVLDVVESAA
jgi:hypothetical protein